ncbi:MAG TPA: DUF2330 domain-containing protein [Methylomirabilota bacterium]|nr:DUF2330 domain-containing protein [Methylomirabilota bacterium]
MRSRVHASLLALLAVCALPEAAPAFCGFYVASGEAKLFNHRSQVALVRDGDRTVMTMASDYAGDPKEFALIVPVPVVLKRGQIHVGDSSLVAKLDAYSAPRLVEYHDPDPCPVAMAKMLDVRMSASRMLAGAPYTLNGAMEEGVRVEARYEIDEYDVLILSATDSGALLTWLKAHGYRVPMQASRVVESYLKQGMKFFVAKVDLRRRAAAGIKTLRPLQIAYESPKFMLPVRLGMANADGPQELFVYAVTRTGRVEPVNYRSLKLPESVDAPAFVKSDFSTVWRAAFDHLVEKNGMGVVYTEYAWDMTWCDPCPSPPLDQAQLRSLGVWWLEEGDRTVFLTRLHARYDRASFPEDLVLQATADRSNFQAKVVVHNEWQGDAKCENANAYKRSLPARREREAASLAEFTGWSVNDVRTRMGMSTAWLIPGESMTPYNPSAWWEKLWKN